MSIHIVTDSTSDIPDNVLVDLPISVIPLYLTVNGKSYLDRVDLSRDDFYRMLPDSDPHPTTAAPSSEHYIEVYDQAAEQGATAIFSIHISETLSATIQSARTAAKQYTRIPVYPVDSGNLSMAEGLIVIKAAQAAKAGKSVEEVRAVIDSVIPRTHAYAKLDTIDYLLKGGRMSSIQYSVVSLLGIKPILKMSNHVSRMEIARTSSRAFERVLSTALENFPYAEIYGVTHANVPDQVETLIKRFKEIAPGLPEPMVSEVTPTLGTHVGPGALCVNWIESLAHHEEEEKKGFRKWLP
jgi:DegV family protein with EDD domain